MGEKSEVRGAPCIAASRSMGKGKGIICCMWKGWQIIKPRLRMYPSGRRSVDLSRIPQADKYSHRHCHLIAIFLHPTSCLVRAEIVSIPWMSRVVLWSIADTRKAVKSFNNRASYCKDNAAQGLGMESHRGGGEGGGGRTPFMFSST